jgi:hypothetical protein
MMPLLKVGVAERNVSAWEAPIAGMSQVRGDNWLFGPGVGGELGFTISRMTMI